MDFNYLVNKVGVSCYEESIIRDLYKYIVSLKLEVQLEIDSIGNLIVMKRNKFENKQNVLISAHVDEIGIKITGFNLDGTVKFEPIGSLKITNIYMQRVRVGNLTGVVYSNFNLYNIEIRNCDKLYIDFGFLGIEDAVKNLNIGDIGTFENNFFENEDLIISKSIDNRVGIYILLDLIRNVNEFDFNLIYVFSVQEEIGCIGIENMCIQNNIDLGICVDCTFVENSADLFLGFGPCIKIHDELTTCDLNEINRLKSIASNNQIKYQLEMSNSGATELAFMKCDKLIGISIPIKYGHTANGIVKKEDIYLTYKIIKKYLEAINKGY